MTEMPVAEFAKDFERHVNDVQHEPIAITNDGQVIGYFMSVRQYQELQRLRTFELRMYRIRELQTEIAEAIEAIARPMIDR
jgi:PHD/YefM family antitoxin component YafN of YafNO toxin-antitoxin module